MNIEALARPNIRSMQAYSSGKSEFSGKAHIFIDTNENPFGDNVVNRYPDPLQKRLVQRIAEVKSGVFKTSLSVDNFSLGNGSDELIDMLMRIFCSPGIDSIVNCPPTFGMYEVAANLNDVHIINVPLDSNFDLDVEGILKENGKAKLLVLCTPNNPTGNCMSADRMYEVIRQWQGIVVIDEAYIDFCPECSLIPKLHEFPNLAILQTLSKAWGMAGVRLGMCIAGSEITALLRKVKMPYNIGVLKENFVMERLSDIDFFEHERQTILAEKARMKKELANLTTKVFPSDANFLLVRFADGQKVYDHLKQNGVIVRNFSSKPRLENCLRITIGTPQENDTVISLLKRIS